MKKLLFLIALILPNIAFMQNENNIWHFGNFAGLDFNSGSPVAITGGALSTVEGCSSMCDSDGNLLFYTDGVTVWNSNHTAMPNGSGLLGGTSSSQSAISIKLPGSEDIYYVFTVAQGGAIDGLRYSVLDMSLDGGLGNITANKNIPIVSYTCEKVAAIKHQNNTDFWIVTHLIGGDVFHCYLLTDTGLEFTPVVSQLGHVLSGGGDEIGYVKGSPDGSKLAIAHYYDDVAQLFDFNNLTGEITNTMTFNSFSDFGCYGIEFSPNSDILYVSESSTPSSLVYQYDLLAGGEAEIAASRITVAEVPGWGGTVQLGPDSKIYVAEYGTSFVGVIDDPNTLGLDCNFQLDAVPLSGFSCQLGLPTNFVINQEVPSISALYLCLGDITLFNVNSNSEITSYSWDFDDPSSGIANTSVLETPTHTYAAAGTYEVTLTVVIDGIESTVIQEITISNYPDIDLGPDNVICSGELFIIDAETPGGVYTWQDGSTESTFSTSTPGIYNVEVSVNGCVGSDEIELSTIPLPEINLGDDLIVCQGTAITLDATTSGASYAWQDGSINPTYSVEESGIYSIIITDDCNNQASDNVEIIFEICSSVLEMPNIFSPNGDETNQNFLPSLQENIIQFEMIIYNRWGNEVHRSLDSMIGWDGQYNDNECAEGTYYWIVQYTDKLNDSYTKSGYVMLTR